MQPISPEQRDESDAKFLLALRAHRAALTELLAKYAGEWGYDYRMHAFYNSNVRHGALRGDTERIVAALRAVYPERELNDQFLEIIREGTRRTSEFPSEDDPGPSDSRHILEAFFHAHYMLEMAARYSSLEEPPPEFPCGWGVLLHLYNLY